MITECLSFRSLVLFSLTGFSKNLITTTKKQLNWGTKTGFNGSKFDHSTDLKI